MTINVYVPPADYKLVKLAKRAAKQKKQSLSSVAMDAIRAWARENEAAPTVASKTKRVS